MGLLHSIFTQCWRHAGGSYTLFYLMFCCRVAMTAVQQLPYDEVLRLQAKALFSKQEEELLTTVTVVCFTLTINLNSFQV